MLKKLIKVLFCSIIIILFSTCNDNKKNKTEIQHEFENEKLSVDIGNKKMEVRFSFDINKTEINERLWKNFIINSKLIIGNKSDETFYYPSSIKIDNDKNIFVLDNIACCVKKFDSTGHFIKSFGKRGRGPGEVMNAFSFDVSGDGKVVITDLNANKFVVFERDKIYEYNCKLSPMEVSFINKNEIMTYQILDPITISPIQKVDYLQNTTISYQNILDKSSFKGSDFSVLPFLIGDLHTYKSKELVFVSSILGYVVTFKGNGTIDGAFKLIEDINESDLLNNNQVIDSEYLFKFPRKKDYLLMSSNVYGDNLYVFTNPYRYSTVKNIVDIYSISKRRYKYSLLFPKDISISTLFFTDNKLFLIHGNTELEVFDYKILD
jgi:hypothetical protein